ncbi:uncharacterized protein LOC124141231 [Haliotis rufescens]|uniref:uncharacterized protein LOC124141231 n=1 Tax=Haliotis rufescens TaxID=6454 RepID=UPI00201F2FC4|nr:uncharacterized protein LOC124141231 [Haliotis rufescens]
MMDFNPLDLLAAAAALQRDDPKSSNQSGGQTQSEANCDDTNTEESTEEEDPNKSNKMGSARKLRSEIKRQNSCNLPTSEVGKLFSEKSSGVDYVVDEDSPGRTIRRHSWSAEGEVVGDSDSAIITDLSVEHKDSKTDSSQKVVEESDDTSCERDSLDNGESGCGESSEVSEGPSQTPPPPPSDPAGAQSADDDDSSDSASVKETSEDSPLESYACDVSVTEPAQLEQVDESVLKHDNVSDFDLTEPTAACCPVCHKPRTDYAVGVSDPSELCAICEKQTVSENDEAASPSGSVEEPVSGSAAGPSISVIDNEQSESGFVAIVSDRTCSDATDNEEKSSLLETYLTTGHTEKVQEDSFSMEMHASKSSEECIMDTTDCDVRMESSDASGPASSVESDHSYASQPGKVTERQSTDYYDTETGAESDSCGENSSTEEVEHRARSMSIESVCLRFGFEDKHMTLPVKEHEDSDHMSGEPSLLSPTSSVDSSMTDFPSFKLTPLPLTEKDPDSTVQQQTLQGFSSSDGCDSRLSSPIGSVDSLHGQIPPKVGKFRIGTFASFSSSNIKSDNSSPATGSKNFRLNVSKDHSTLSSPYFDKGLISSPPMSVPPSPGLPSFLQSPCGDWERSDAGSEVQDELGPPHCSDSTISNGGLQNSTEPGLADTSSVHHDHDYCLREGHLPRDYGIDTTHGKQERRKYSSWSKTKSGIARHVKEPKLKTKAKVKKIKVELLDSPTGPAPSTEDVTDFKQPFEVDFVQDRAHSVIGRTSRRRLEKLQEQLELDNGSKLKITGKFKDDYVYYLNKSSRSRRRASTDLPPPPPTDKIIIPAPKPGDIIVPHLTDADIEAIKRRGKAGLSISEKYYGAGLSSTLHSGGSTPSTASQTQSSQSSPQAPTMENIVDMDSRIISTILSMENDSLGSPGSAHDSSLSDTVDLYSPSEDSVGISFMGENMTLTPDQVNILLDAVKDVETTPEEIIDSAAGKYNLDNNQNYDRSVDNIDLSDQQSVDGVSTSDETERRQSVSSAASEFDTESKDRFEIKNEPATAPASTTDPAAAVATTTTTVASPAPPADTSETTAAPSQVVVPPTVNPSESPVRALLEADLGTIGDIEKPFDLLGHDFRLDKSDLFPDAAVMDSSAPSMTTSTTTATSAASDYNTPWIVTVTMFWNDLPAIMIENQPFVRLVDIHKQILPAKDTGILKKRCQLLGIDVLNCSEMQRYFLVQYGRAYNSKSTLIVSKDYAKNLIGYYVNPQPRMSKLDEVVRRDDPELSSDGSLASLYSGESQPVKVTAGVLRKKIKPKAQPRTAAVEKMDLVPITIPIPAVTPSQDVPLPVTEIAKEIPPPLESKRLRHKKINFLELLKGETNTESCVVAEPVEEKTSEKEEEVVCENGKKTAVPPASPNGKKKTKLSDAEKLKLAKEELKKRKVELLEEAVQEKKSARVVEQDSEEENHSSPSNRRRFSGSRSRGANPPLNGNRRSRLKKMGPLKVKIKGLIHFKKGNKKNVSDTDKKIIEIRHKDPKPTNSHPSVTQDGDIHLDLYQKKSSLCIKCCSCKKFFSLRNFLTHQHYPDDTEILTTVAQPQVLEPRSIKLSDRKKGLWQEFNKRRKQLEGPKPVNESKPIVLSKPLNIVNKSVITTSHSVPSHAPKPATVHKPPSLADAVPPGYKPASELEAQLRKKIEVPQFKQPVTVTGPPRRAPGSSGVRVSSRKRKERQLFPIENYSFAKKVARLDLPMNGEEAMDVSPVVPAPTEVKAAAAAAEACNSVLTLSNGPELTNYTALQDGPEI